MLYAENRENTEGILYYMQTSSTVCMDGESHFNRWKIIITFFCLKVHLFLYWYGFGKRQFSRMSRMEITNGK